MLNPKILKSQPSQHFTPADSGDAQDATVEILEQPFSFQGHAQHGRTERAGEMG